MCAAEWEGGRGGNERARERERREAVGRGGRKRSVETGVYMITMNGEGQQLDYNERRSSAIHPGQGMLAPCNAQRVHTAAPS